MLKKLFAAIISAATLFCTSVSMVGVHAEEIIYPTGTINGGKGTLRTLIPIGVPYNLDEYMKGVIQPANATVNEDTIVYSLKEGTEEFLTLNEDRTVIANEEGSGTVYANFKNSDGELTGDRVAIYTVATTELKAFFYQESSASYKFDPEADTHDVYVYNPLETEPALAVQGIYFTEIEYSTSDESIAYYEYDTNHGLRLIAKKPGDVTVYAKYKDFTASYQLHIYEEKAATKMECPDEVIVYPGYLTGLKINYGEEENVSTKVEVLEGADCIEPLDEVQKYDELNIFGVKPGTAVLKLTSISNPDLSKNVTIIVREGKADPKENYTFVVYEKGDNGYVALPESDHYELVYGQVYKFELSTKYGFDDMCPPTGVPFKIVGGGNDTNNNSYILFEIDQYGTYEFQFPAYPITFTVVEKKPETSEKPETPSDKPTVETGSAEDTKVEVSDAISKEDAAVITETLSKAEVTSVVDTIKPEAKKALIAELTKGIDTEGKEVTLSVVNTVKVTAADLKSENKSITYEISPKAVVTVDGVAVNTVDLKNNQLTGNEDIEVTLPINGLDLKEIVHKSEGYDPDYIYDFVISKEGTVTFKISHFSSFTLNEVITKPTEPSKGTVGTVSPNTGDHTEVMLYGGIGIVALIGALAVILFRRKHA